MIIFYIEQYKKLKIYLLIHVTIIINMLKVLSNETLYVVLHLFLTCFST